jgi:ABC-type glutathione transport system ATPase component
MPVPLLQVRDLCVQLGQSGKLALDHISFDLVPGETLGVLGESGAGKTTLARSLIQLLPSGLRMTSGAIQFNGKDLLRASERQLRQLRGAEISLICQEPELALNPVIPAGKQVAEVLRAHSTYDRHTLRAQAQSMLSAAGLDDPRVYAAYPHQLSGGQRQRVVIAQALISKPSLLIADEPTSSLDNIVQDEILALLKDWKNRLQLAVIFITHNPALLAGFADRVMVMSSGRIVEVETFETICRNPSHPYTRNLWKSIPPLPPHFVSETNDEAALGAPRLQYGG